MQVKKPRKRRPERISIATTQASSNHSFDTNVSALRLRGRLANPGPPRLSRRALDEIVTIAMAWPMSEKSVILNGAASTSYVYQDPVSERVIGMENEVRDALSCSSKPKRSRQQLKGRARRPHEHNMVPQTRGGRSGGPTSIRA